MASDPFYLGLYGGSDLPGFLASDADAEPFLTRQGYRVADTTLVLHRRLDKPLTLADPRFAACRRQYEVRMAPRGKGGTWWREGVLGPVELLEFHLTEKGGQTVARAGPVGDGGLSLALERGPRRTASCRGR